MHVAIAEDNGFFRNALGTLLGALGVDVVTSVDNGDELLALATSTPPDVAMIDLRMPPTHTDEGLVTALELKRRLPATGILVLTAHNVTEYAMQLFQGEPKGMGYLLKDNLTDAGMLRDALERVGRGEVVIDPTVVGRLVDARRAGDELNSLTGREREVLALMAEGHSNIGIGRIIHLSDRTVEDYVRNIFGKLGITDVGEVGSSKRVLAVLAWLRAIR